jgi:hypothetical protein
MEKIVAINDKMDLHIRSVLKSGDRQRAGAPRMIRPV